MSEVGVLKEIDRVGRIVITKELRERYALEGDVELVATKEGLLIKSQEYFLIKKGE